MIEDVVLCINDPDKGNPRFEGQPCFHTEQDHLENDITGLKECQLCSCTEWIPGSHQG